VDPLTDEALLLDLGGAAGWLNSAPLDGTSLRGKVVLVNFWTYTCINSLRPMPYWKAWAERYKDAGLVAVGVHTPEFSFEKERSNVETAVRDLRVSFPVAIDSDYRIWEALDNQYWPAMYFVDAKGRIRHQSIGEGGYVEAEQLLRVMLEENGALGLDGSPASIAGDGIEAAPSNAAQSPETYVGYRRAERFASLERMVKDVVRSYRAPAPRLNHWGLIGSWKVSPESAALAAAGGGIVFRFQGRDLHLVLAPGKQGHPVPFKVRLDGAVPGDAHGVDSAADGSGEVRQPRLYQLVRQRGRIEDRTFEIEFLDAGVQAVVFTFG
jgi:thiol-disulfide isomerase/thioredoxin